MNLRIKGHAEEKIFSQRIGIEIDIRHPDSAGFEFRVKVCNSISVSECHKEYWSHIVPIPKVKVKGISNIGDFDSTRNGM